MYFCSHTGVGKVFRQWYCRVVQIRSLLTPVAALTATITADTKERIVNHLQLCTYTTIHRSPDRAKIKYCVKRVSRELSNSFQWLVKQLCLQRVKLPKVLIFCCSVATCANLYKLFLTSLREESYVPLGISLTITNQLFAKQL